MANARRSTFPSPESSAPHLAGDQPIARSKVRFAAASPLEGAGFEPSVPRPERLRQMETERRQKVQERYNQIYLDRSIRAAQRGTERIRAEKAFLKAEALRSASSSLNDRDWEIIGRAHRIAIYGSCLIGLAAICAMIVHWYPNIVPVGYGIVIGLGLLAGWIAFKFLASDGVLNIMVFAFKHPAIAAVIVAVGAVIVMAVRSHSN
jgi:hypothetical protein